MRRALLLTALLLALGGALASRYAPLIERVVVAGNAHYSPAEIRALAQVEVGEPLLWVHRWRLQGLVDDPWIARARVVREWPASVTIQVWERRAAMLMDGELLAIDGTVLGEAPSSPPENLVIVRGWGESRRDEAVALVQLLEEYEPKVLSYSPGGFDIELQDGRLFTPDLEALKEHWSGFTSQQGKSVYVYPWGVSVEQ